MTGHNLSSNHFSAVAVIGAGLMGHGIAQLFATRNVEVHLHDIDSQALSRALKNVASNLDTIAANDLIQRSEIEQIIGRIHTHSSMEEAVADAGLVVEAVSENVDLKQKVFRALDELCRPSVILATNTSAISISDISKLVLNRHRVVGTHFWNPPYLIPLVEVVKGSDTAQDTVDVVYDFLQRVGKRPVKVRKDVPGFIGNRLQHALWREAISLVESEIAEADDVDEVISSGFGLRLPALGPLRNADLVGLDLTLAIHDYLLPHISSMPAPSPLLRQKASKQELGCKSGKGFYDWTPEDEEEVKRQLMAHLMAAREVRDSFSRS